MSWQFPLFFFEFADQPLRKHSVLFQCGPTANSVCISKFNPRQHTSTIRSSKHRRQMIKIIGPDYPPWSATNSARSLTFWPLKHWARSIQPKFPEISVQNSMDRFSPTEKVSEKMVHLFRWSSFAGRTGLNFGWMDRAHCRLVSVVKLTTFSRFSWERILFLNSACVNTVSYTHLTLPTKRIV